MLPTAVLLVASALAPLRPPSASPTPTPPTIIHVDCRAPGALERALARAQRLRGADLHLHGVCEGNHVIDTNGVTLRGVTPDAALVGRPELPVIEVRDAQVTLRSLAVRNGVVGVLAQGWNAELLLVGVHVETHEVGVLASDGAEARMLDSSVSDGVVGVQAQHDSRVNLQNVVVDHHELGVVAFEESEAILNDVTVEQSDSVGVAAQLASRVLIWGGTLRDNGEVHVGTLDRSDLTLLSGVVVGSESDGTEWAMGAARHSSITSYGSPVVHGGAYALDGASLRLGETELHGPIFASLFSDAHVRDSTVTEGIVCDDGADVICARVSTPSTSGCPSSTCGGAAREAGAAAPGIAPPTIRVRAFDWRARARQH